MFAWLRESPGVARALALLGAAIVVSEVAVASGEVLDWGTALLYGIALAVSMRWPIVMGSTGARVVLISGLLLEALWHHGPSTAAMALLVEFGARMLVLYQGRYYWEWHRPLLVLGAFFSAYALQILTEGGMIIQPHHDMPHLATPGLVMAYGFWALLNAAWTVLKAPAHGRSRAQELWLVLQQTWWVPLTFLLAAWPMMLVHSNEYPLEILVAILLVWIQSQVGPVFTTMNQDRAMARFVRTNQAPDPVRKLLSQRVLRVANGLGHILGLSDRELRVLGYAALLQDYYPEGTASTPLWVQAPLSSADRAVLGQQVQATARQVETDGCLQEVADVIRFRFAAYNGQGYPQRSGDTIPAAAQILGAANAAVWLMMAEDGLHLADGKAVVRWLRENAPGQFSTQIMSAMSQALIETDSPPDLQRGLPETVRLLKGLVSEPDTPSQLRVGLRRIWQQIRGQAGLAPDLPLEVQAVARLATYFASSTQAGQTAQIAADVVGQLMSAKVAVAVGESENSELSLLCRASYGMQTFDPRGLSLDLNAGPIGRAVMAQSPMQVADVRELHHPIAQEMGRAEGVRSALFVPLVHRGRTIGLLLVGLTRQHWFTPREVGLIHLMAGQMAAALENARLIGEVEERLEHISNLKSLNDTLLDNLSGSILVVDPEGRLVMANAAARQRFGNQHPILIGMPLPQELATAARVERALQGEAVPEEDVAWGAFMLEMQAIPLKDNRGIAGGAIVLARDVTQVRTMEQQVRRVEKLAAIGELAAGAAHEIRNPLTSIRGFIQLLQNRALRGDGDYFQIILNEIDRIDGIIRDMLLLAKPSDVVKAESDLPALIDEVLLLHQTELLRQNIAVECSYAPAMPMVAVDLKSFRQLVLNLVINSMQAMPYGGTLRLTVRPEGVDRAVLIVSDTGVGISSENLKRLFVPFFTTKEEGTGLGLALCYSIVQAHGGKIDVESRVGLGTSFRITLPLK